jgi:sensor histidine kinase YesM
MEEWVYRKHRLFVSVSFISALYALFFLPLSLLEKYYGAAYVIVFFITCNTMFPFLLRRGVSLMLVVYAYIFVLALSLGAIMFISGGVYHTATDPQLMVLLPVMALLFISFRAAIMWFFIAVIIVATFGVLQLRGVVFNIRMDPEYVQLQNLLAVCGHILLVFLVINIFEKQKNEAFEKLVADVSLTALRSQMNPHFIFNCLNSIKLYTTQNDRPAALEYLTKFSKLIRLTMENSRNDKIALALELNALQLYVEMEAMRFKEKLQYNIHVDDDVEIDYIEVPPLLLQPYVENAIWHGLMHKEEGGKIDVDISMIRNRSILQINITDNGIGRKRSAELKSKTATTHKSYGMKVTSERIELINQIYRTSAEIKIFDLTDANENPAGTTVTIFIPIQ